MRNNIQLEETARIIATAGHAAVAQKRKYTGEDYIVHPAEVVSLLIKYSTSVVSSEQIAACWCHDLVEDTKITIDLIRHELGPIVAEYVDFLTDRSKPTDGNRKVRKEIDRQHIALAPRQVKDCKLCDLISNSLSIVEHDLGFAGTYLREKTALLEVMQDADPGLLAEATRIVKESRKKLFGED